MEGPVAFCQVLGLSEEAKEVVQACVSEKRIGKDLWYTETLPLAKLGLGWVRGVAWGPLRKREQLMQGDSMCLPWLEYRVF